MASRSAYNLKFLSVTSSSFEFCVYIYIFIVHKSIQLDNFSELCLVVITLGTLANSLIWIEMRVGTMVDPVDDHIVLDSYTQTP